MPPLTACEARNCWTSADSLDSVGQDDDDDEDDDDWANDEPPPPAAAAAAAGWSVVADDAVGMSMLL